MNSFYALFSLFFHENIFTKISQFINIYSHTKRVESANSQKKREFFKHWQDSISMKIRIFIVILIYMRIHDSKRINLYFRRDSSLESVHTSQFYISQFRFEQLKRYIYISESRTVISNVSEKNWWYKLESLTFTFKESCKKYYISSSNIAVNEIMIKCFERIKHTVKISHKLIKQRYKMFALTEHDYVWIFFWSSRQLSIEAMFKYFKLTLTESMILNMMKELSRFSLVD